MKTFALPMPNIPGLSPEVWAQSSVEIQAKEKSGKKPGGQSGHRGKHRPVMALEKVDEVVQHFPEECGECGQELSAEDNLDEEPERRQVAELPVVKIIITEHQLQRRTCKSCGSISKAKPPPGVAQSAFGPHLQAEPAVA